jgi:hypothetical protein
MNLQNFKDTLAVEIHGMTKDEAVQKNLCIAQEKIELQREWLPPEADFEERVVWYSKRLRLADHLSRKVNEYYEIISNDNWR